jgi:hypothetical protein
MDKLDYGAPLSMLTVPSYEQVRLGLNADGQLGGLSRRPAGAFLTVFYQER